MKSAVVRELLLDNKSFPMRSGLHSFAALLLLAFAAVKIAAMRKDLPLLHLQSSLFPFFTVRTLYFFVIALEISAAFCCLKFRGQAVADYCVWVFIALMLCYRLGLYLMGDDGYGCACLGLLTLVLHLSTGQEKAISVGALVVLGLCTTPGLALMFKRWTRPLASRVSFLGWLVLGASASAETTEIRGHYHYRRHNAETGAPFTNDIAGVSQGGSFHFTTLLNKREWKISVTNAETPRLWSEIVFDGTNTFTFAPYSPPFVSEKEEITNAIFATISPSPLYLPVVSDWAYASVPWLTFGLDPARLTTNKSGLVEIPLAWETARRKLLAYGWQWNVTSTENSRFATSCQIIRNSRLDLAQSKELLRWDLNYPEDILTKNMYLNEMRHRKSIPDGFLETQYTCKAWLNTNGIAIPASSEMKTFLFGYSLPCMLARLNVESVTIHPEALSVLKSPSARLIVQDYRYKKANSSRIFKYAEYTLEPGMPWKGSQDPLLLGQALDHLKKGTRYNYYDYTFKQVSVWVLLAVILLLPMAFMLKNKNNKQKDKIDTQT